MGPRHIPASELSARETAFCIVTGACRYSPVPVAFFWPLRPWAWLLANLVPSSRGRPTEVPSPAGPMVRSSRMRPGAVEKPTCLSNTALKDPRVPSSEGPAYRSSPACAHRMLVRQPIAGKTPIARLERTAGASAVDRRPARASAPTTSAPAIRIARTTNPVIAERQSRTTQRTLVWPEATAGSIRTADHAATVRPARSTRSAFARAPRSALMVVEAAMRARAQAGRRYRARVAMLVGMGISATPPATPVSTTPTATMELATTTP